jgi:hypothetical protein
MEPYQLIDDGHAFLEKVVGQFELRRNSGFLGGLSTLPRLALSISSTYSQSHPATPDRIAQCLSANIEQ